jgi:acyl-ACP thioesterase
MSYKTLSSLEKELEFEEELELEEGIALKKRTKETRNFFCKKRVQMRKKRT